MANLDSENFKTLASIWQHCQQIYSVQLTEILMRECFQNLITTVGLQ